jgi:O-antigen/teichoic acid export membrane protein
VLGVEALGKYSFYASAQSYLLLFSSFGVSIYGVKEMGQMKKANKEKSELYSQLISINLLTSLLCSIFILYIAFFSEYSNDWKIILVFAFSLISSVLGPDWYFIANEKQKYLLIRNIIFKVLFILSIFLFIRKSEDLLAYVIITVLGTYGTSIINFFIIRKELDIKIDFGTRTFGHLKPLFGIFLIEILLRFLGLGDVILLGRIKGDVSTGYYSMALKVILLAISIMNVTATTLLPRASFYLSNNQKEDFKCLTQRSLSILFNVGGLLFLLLFWNADFIILLLGGEKFYHSIEVLRILSITLLVIPIINTLVFQVLYAKNRIFMLVIIYIFILVLNISLNLFLIPKYDFFGTAYSFLITYFVLFVILIMNKKENLLIYFSKDIFKILGAIIATFVLTYLLINIFNSVNFVIKGFYIFFLYVFILLSLKEKVLLSLCLIIKNAFND